ncbi:MAG: hydroxymethylglutaryl-CoA lyase [Deltaproteobacteria bacterium]|nr:hydroxymethylglutaryl-CoA lyase [Deltaproteobacteria bacterium]
MKLPGSVKIREVGPRDGFQSLKRLLPVAEKVEIIEALIAAGVPEVEATSFASVKALPQFQDAEQVLTRVSGKNTLLSAMVFNEKGARRALSAGAGRLVTVVSATDAHSRANMKCGIDAALKNLDAIFQAAFGCPFQGDVPETEVFRVVRALVSKGADAVILADTVGTAVPNLVENRVKAFRERFFETELILHFHNNRGTAMANLFAALLSGATVFDTALGGLGGCPYVPRAAGNIPTEDAVYMLEEMGVETGIDLEALIAAARRLESIVGHPLPGQVMKSGPRMLGLRL